MASTTYTLNVNIDPSQVTILKTSGYKLCLSKKVNGIYCVVWQGTEFDVTNQFQWQEQYQTYASLTFDDGALVKASTNKVGIALGQTATIDKNGVLGKAIGPVTGDYFSVVNKWKPCHIAVDQKFNGAWAPIFVDPGVTVQGTAKLTPIVSVLLFFSREYQTGTMFLDVQSSTYEASYLGQGTDITVSYTDINHDGNGVWSEGNASAANFAGFRAVLPRSYSAARGFEVLPQALDPFYVSTLISKLDINDGVGNLCEDTGDIVAHMTFPYVDAASAALTNIAKYHQSGWPGNYDMSAVLVGDRSISAYDPTELIVQLENKADPSGPTQVVKDAWSGFWDHTYPKPLVVYRKK